MALTKVTGQVINNSTGLVVGVTTVGGGVSAVDGFFSGIVTFSNDVSVAGTLTYEDVTNIDAVGLVTARNGIVVGSGITLSKDGDIFATGITTISENLKVGTGVTISPDGDGFFTGVVTATSYAGDGSNLTGITAGTTLSGSTDNTVCTVTGANAIQGESNVQIDSSGRLLIGTTTEGQASADDLTIATSGNTGITLRSGTSNAGNIYFSDATSGTAEYAGYVSYSHSTNNLSFGTNDGTERLSIDSSGRLGIQGAATRALLEVRASGGSNTMLTALWGANEGTTAGTLTDNTDKAVRMGVHHYDTDALPFGLLVASAGSSSNTLNFGGGTSLMNAATQIQFTTAANTTTTSGTTRMTIDSSGHVLPGANNTYNLGSTSLRWANIYSADLQLSNEGKTNDVDGTWGNYTIQEGESDLFLINNRTGKKYKFNLTEVT